jgi:hypothetical protein
MATGGDKPAASTPKTFVKSNDSALKHNPIAADSSTTVGAVEASARYCVAFLQHRRSWING